MQTEESENVLLWKCKIKQGDNTTVNIEYFYYCFSETLFLPFHILQAPVQKLGVSILSFKISKYFY